MNILLYSYLMKLEKVRNMKNKNELAGSLCAEQFQNAISHTQIAEKSKSIAFEVLVKGNSITSVAKKNDLTYQRVKSICERVYYENARKDVQITVSIPSDLVEHAKQLITTLTSAYLLAKRKGGIQ